MPRRSGDPSSQELEIRNFLGLNLLDGADRVRDNEFTSLQNVWQPSKGLLSNRFGSVPDISSIPLCSRISGVWRHYAPNGEKFTLYHCVPDSALIPDNTADLVLGEASTGTGNLFGGGAIAPIRVAYSWIGRGIEQTYNSKNRTGFPAPGSFPLDAWNNPGHQSITLIGANSTIQVTVPAFPAGVTGANIFAARGTATQMTYMGTVTTSGGSLFLSEFIGPNSARIDAITLGNTPSGLVYTGSLPPGTYYVGAAWVCDPVYQEGNVANITGSSTTFVNSITAVSLSGKQNTIQVTAPTANSTNGAQALYVFVGTQDPNFHPMTCVGIIRAGAGGGAANFIDIGSIPSHNAQTSPSESPTSVAPRFWAVANSSWVGGSNQNVGSKFLSRYGFVVASRNGGALQEVFPSRSLFYLAQFTTHRTYFAGDSAAFEPGAYVDLHNFFPWPRTKNDLHQSINQASVGSGYIQPFVWSFPATDPNFTYQLGISYFANSIDIPWQTDGYTLGQIVPVFTAGIQTLLPPPPKLIRVYQNSLIAAGGRAQNQIFASNANSPQNWASGGSGTALIYATIGDAVGGGATALGSFTPATDTTSNPGSFVIAFKKNGAWMAQSIVASSPMTQIAGRVGCTAYRTVLNAPLGTIFLGQDGNVYLINRVAEPTKIGTRIQPLLAHLVPNDSWMQMCTAVYHDNHYKLSYPSPAAVKLTAPYNDSELWADLRTEGGAPITWVGPHRGRNIGSQVVLAGDTDDLSRLCADSNSVRTFTADPVSTLTDLGSPVVPQIQSKIFRFGSQAHQKRILGAISDLFLDYSYSNSVLLEGFADADYQQVSRALSTAGGVWDGSNWDASNFADALYQGFSFLFGGTNLTGRTFQWRMTYSGTGPFVLAGITLLLKPERRRTIL